jgi:UDPglucose 6-dehydrogenase
MKITVIGTGYVGLVTGTCLAEIGHNVTCVDIDESKIDRLKKGELPIYEQGLSELVINNAAAKRLHFTTDLKTIGQPEAIFFALPTPPDGDGQADLSYVLKASADVAKTLKGYTVLVNKSTVPIGTAQKVWDVVAKNTKIDFDVVSNPEFLKEGTAVEDCMNPDRIIVGTSSDKALSVIQEIYKPFTATGVELMAMDTASAEMTKYAANSFLAVKVSFMNEIANLCELTGATVDQVKRGIGADIRIGNRFLNAGIGYGGSCFPKDVMALERIGNLNDYDFKILKAVIEVNTRQKQIIPNKITAHYGENLAGKTFAMWGLAFKPDSDDIREAPALEIVHELVGRGAKIQAYDPEAMQNVRRMLDHTIHYATSAPDALKGADSLIVATEWKEFASVTPRSIAKALKDKTVFDGRNLFEIKDMIEVGINYFGIGRPR